MINSKHLKVATLLLFILSSLLVRAKHPDIKLAEESISFSYTFDDLEIHRSTNDPSALSFIIPGFQNIIGTGLPALPKRVEKFIVPEGYSIGELQVIEKSDTIYGECLPAKTLHSNSFEGEFSDQPITPYSGVWPMTSVQLESTGIYRDQQIARISIMPVRYDYTNKCFIQSLELTYNITLVPNAMCLTDNSSVIKHNINPENLKSKLTIPPFTDVLQPAIETRPPNPEDDPVYYGTACEKILIICPQDLKEQAERLGKWKQRIGYSYEVYTPLNETDLYDPNLTQTLIKNRYSSERNLEYVILFGSGERIIPFKSPITVEFAVTQDRVTTKVPRTPYTDFYFGCMDGEKDLFADVCIGRIPAYNEGEARIMVDKIINYEKEPPLEADNFFNTGLHISEWDHNFIWTSEWFYNYMEDRNFNIDRVYYANLKNGHPKTYIDGTPLPLELQYPNFKWDGTAKDIQDKWNEKGYNYVLCRGHANVTQWTNMIFDSSQAYLLKNGNKLPFVFSINCLSGAFYDGQSYRTRSLCERLLTNRRGGAIAVIGASDYSCDEYNDIITAALMYGINPDAFGSDFVLPGMDMMWGRFGNEYFQFGRLLEYGRELMLEQIVPKDESLDTEKEPLTWKNYYYNRDVYNVLGDPTLRMYLGRPNIINVEDVMSGASQPKYDSRRIIIAGKNGTTGYLTDFKEWGPKMVVPGDSTISIIGNKYVPVLMEEYQAKNVNMTGEGKISFSNISKSGNDINVILTDIQPNTEIAIYNVVGDEIYSQNINDKNITISKVGNGFKIITLKVEGEIVDYKRIY